MEEPLFSTAPGKWKGSDSDQKIRVEGDKWRVKMETGEDESRPSVNLDLGIGGPTTSSCSSSDYHHHRLKNKNRALKVEDHDHDHDHDRTVEERGKQRSRKCSVVCFTEEQMEELKTQLMIFKYMVSGLPVPLQLLLPIWRCFCLPSLSPFHSDLLRRRYPFFLGLSGWGFNNQYPMDREPWRCRRTDGKKWRCHRTVIPNEKYCERHMHRGSKRSRKLVEEGSTQASLNPGSPALMNTNPKSMPSNDLKNKLPANLNQIPHLRTQKNPSNVVGGSSEAKNCPTRVVITVPSLMNSAKSSETKEQKDVEKHKSIMKERIAAITLSSGLDFSPKSVLQGSQKCPRVENPKTDPNTEAGRCRRTDGKRWRCRKNVLPDQKYCGQHINRGSKRQAVTLSAFGLGKPPIGSSSGANCSTPCQAKLSMDLNTSVNVSLAISSDDPRHYCPEDSVAHNAESGSTTETTITDDSVDFSDMIVLSP